LFRALRRLARRGAIVWRGRNPFAFWPCVAITHRRRAVLGDRLTLLACRFLRSDRFRSRAQEPPPLVGEIVERRFLGSITY